MKQFSSIFAMLLLLLATGVSAQTDSDGDGVFDGDDLCPDEDASFFDANGDGCIDPTAHARQIEYWDPSELPLEYVIHENGAPDITDGSDIAAIVAGFDAWSAVAGVTIASTFAGTTPQSAGSGLDGINLVSFEDPDFVALFGNTVIAVGVATSFEAPGEFMGNPVRPGQIVDADMLFNPNRSFTTDGLGTGVDLQAVATHEAGHVFGLNHSAIPAATMFPALPSGIQARTLELDDEILAFMSYPDELALATAAQVSGSVVSGIDLSPVPGAAVFAIAAATDQPVAVQFTLPDGGWRFAGLPAGEYYFYVHPLDGTAGVSGVVPGFINSLVSSTAVTLFLPEYYDSAESADDDPLARTPVTLAPGVEVTGIDVITNVDSTPPQLIAVTPLDNAIDVIADGVVLVRFDEAIEFTSVPSRFLLEKVEGPNRTSVGGQLVTLGGREVLVFTPSGRLDFEADYELTLKAGIEDRFGNPTPADFTTKFTVQSKPPLSILAIDPAFVVSGTIAVISGQGFDTSAAANNFVDFGGVPAVGQSVTFNRLAVVVPDGIALGEFAVIVSTADETAETILTAQGIEVTDFPRGSPVASFPLQGDPRAIAVLPNSRWALAATSVGVEAVLIDGNSIDFGSTVVRTIDGGLDDLAVVPGGRRAYGVNRSGRLLRSIDTDDGGDGSNPVPSFLQPEFDLATVARPRGITIDPAGTRAYVATENGTIQKWDIALGSDTFHEQVGEIDTGNFGLRGAMAFDAFGERVLALTPGLLLVYDTATDSLLAEIPIGSDPRDVELAPQGTLAYVTDSDGHVTVISLLSYLATQTIDADASLRGIALSPTGGLGYTADRRDDEIVVIDLREGQASFRTVVAELRVGNNPIDLSVAPDGQRLLSIHEGSRTLEILGIGFGPELGVPYPAYAKPGDFVAFGGSGIAPFDSTGASATIPFMDFGGILVGLPFGSNEIGSTTNSVWSKVPSNFEGGPIRVATQGAAILGQPDIVYSNPTFLRMFTEEDLAATRSTLAFARTFGNDEDFPWDNTPIGLNNVVHPRGDFVLVEVGNFIEAVGLDDTRADFLKSRGRFPNQNNQFGLHRVFTPDGKLLYTQGQNVVRYFDMDPASPTYGMELGQVDFTVVETGGDFEQVAGLGAMAISPDGSQLIVYVGLQESLYRVPLHGALANVAVESVLIGSAPRKLVFHPSGRWLYSIDVDGTAISVVSLDEYRLDYLTESTLMAFDFGLQDLAVSPDGQRMFVVERLGGLGGNWTMVLFELTSPNQIGSSTSQIIEEGSPADVPASIQLHPNGLRAIVTIPEARIAHLDVEPAYRSLDVIDQIFDDIGSVTTLGLFINVANFTPDGRRLLVSEQTNTVVEVYNYAVAGGPSVGLISGGDQTGVAGRELPAPLILRASNEAGQGVPDMIVDVRVNAGGGSIDGGVNSRNYVTDAQGFVEIRWTLGPDPDVTPGVATNQLRISAPALFLLPTAFSVPDPESIPIQLVQQLPATGTSNLGITTSVQAVFSRSIDRTTVNTGSVVLREAVSGAVVPVVIGFADLDRRVTLLPLTALAYATDYLFEVAASIADLDGNPLPAAASASFSTRAAPAPALDAISAPAATVGTQVTLIGAGFDPERTNNQVNFNGQTLTPSSAAVDQLRFVVPTGAATGPLSVTVGAQTTVARTFTVLEPVTDPVDEISANLDFGLVTQGLAVLPDGSRGYSVVREADQVIPIDLFALTTGDPIKVGKQPVAAVAAPAGDRVYVANFADASLSVIDTSVDQVTDTILLPAEPIALVIAIDGSRVFAITPADSSVHLIDTDATSATFNTVVTSIPTGRGITAAAVSPDGTRLYLGTDDGFLVVGLTSSDFGVVTSIPTGRGITAAAVSPDGGLLILITDSEEIQIVDVAPGSDFGVVTSIPTGRGITAAAVSPDGGLLYLLEEGTDEIVVVAIEVTGTVSALEDGALPLLVTLTEIARFEGGNAPEWVVFDPIDPTVSFVGASGDRRINVFGRTPTISPQVEVDLEMVLFDPTWALTARYVTALVRFPVGFDPFDVDLSTVFLNGKIGAVLTYGISLKNPDADGNYAAAIDFNREDWQREFPVGTNIEVCITGLIAGVPFEGCTLVDNLRPDVLAPVEGDMLMSNTQTTVLWQSPGEAMVDYVEVYFSRNDGQADLVRQGGPLPDTGSFKWTVPELPTAIGRVLVVLYDVDKKPIGGTVTGRIGIDTDPVAVALQEVSVSAENGDAILRWITPLARGLGGFRIWRSEANSEYAMIGEVTYEEARHLDSSVDFGFVDLDVVANVDYAYVLEESREHIEPGEGHRHGPFELRFTVSNALGQNVPNAFNPRTAIRFSVAQEGRTRLVVYDLRGRVVRTLVDEVLRADVYTQVWDGTDRHGQQVSSGVYLYRLETDGFVAARKMTLLR